MLIDLGPTLCDLVKAPRPPTLHGRSLLGAMLGEPLDAAPVYAELLPATSWNHHWRALVDGNWKLIEKLSENTSSCTICRRIRPSSTTWPARRRGEAERLEARACKALLAGETNG